jgi:predicted transcriptional regulator
MRPVVSWMTKSDDAILELLLDTAIALPPAVIAFNTVVSHPTVRRRLPKLLEHGLVRKADEDKGYYEITEKGRQYLAGDLDASELENNANSA